MRFIWEGGRITGRNSWRAVLTVPRDRGRLKQEKAVVALPGGDLPVRELGRELGLWKALDQRLIARRADEGARSQTFLLSSKCVYGGCSISRPPNAAMEAHYDARMLCYQTL
jgi:hypothetical protein